MEEINAITEKIIGAAYKVSNTLVSGFLEKIYENALYIEALKAEFFCKEATAFVGKIRQ